MNVAQPISSDIDSVEFTFLSPKEVRAISVKRIENESTFDGLQNPVPGGLYDTALGAWGEIPYVIGHLLLVSVARLTRHVQLRNMSSQQDALPGASGSHLVPRPRL